MEQNKLDSDYENKKEKLINYLETKNITNYEEKELLNSANIKKKNVDYNFIPSLKYMLEFLGKNDNSPIEEPQLKQAINLHTKDKTDQGHNVLNAIVHNQFFYTPQKKEIISLWNKFEELFKYILNHINKSQ